MIVLHDPHAEVQRSGCISALKILTAARAILDMIYNVWSTSFDITLLDSFCSVIILASPCVLSANLSFSVLLVCRRTSPRPIPPGRFGG